MLERVKGIEPSAQYSQNVYGQNDTSCAPQECTQIRAQIEGLGSPNLARVVAAWPGLASPLKAAILAIVDTVSESKGGRE